MFHARKFALASLLLCLFADGVSAGLILQGNDAAHIALGNQFNAVGAVRGTNASNVTGHAQSACLIRPDWIIATKHGFVDSANNDSLYTNLSVSFGSNFNDSSDRYGILDVVLHPTKDIALARLDRAVSGATPFDLFTGTVGNGMEGFTVGYGLLQYLNDPITTFTGDRRAGFDVVNGVNLFEPENFRTAINRNFLTDYRPLEMGGRNGDSRGAFILANSGSPTNVLAGIIDSGTLTNGFGTSSYYTRLEDEIDWINNITAIPEPSSCALVAVASGLFLFIRKRSTRTRTSTSRNDSHHLGRAGDSLPPFGTVPVFVRCLLQHFLRPCCSRKIIFGHKQVVLQRDLGVSVHHRQVVWRLG